jgi:hypothetical protein
MNVHPEVPIVGRGEAPLLSVGIDDLEEVLPHVEKLLDSVEADLEVPLPESIQVIGLNGKVGSAHN